MTHQYTSLKRRALAEAIEVAAHYMDAGRRWSAEDLNRWARAITLCLLDDPDAINRFEALRSHEPEAKVRPRWRSTTSPAMNAVCP
jgi:hypothetical protein